jgi:hypothetical protein
MSRSLKIAGLVVVLVALAVLMTSLPYAGSAPAPGHGGSGVSCGDKNCPKNTKCCFDCSGNPICVKPGVMCPVCIGESAPSR